MQKNAFDFVSCTCSTARRRLVHRVPNCCCELTSMKTLLWKPPANPGLPLNPDYLSWD
jgi:hypothetical protein